MPIQDITRIQVGDAGSKMNSTIQVLERINRIHERLIEAASIPGRDGVILWHQLLQGYERELWSYLSTKERESLTGISVRSLSLPPLSRNRRFNSEMFLQQERNKLDLWERQLRQLCVIKGFQIKADDDRSNIIMGGA